MWKRVSAEVPGTNTDGKVQPIWSSFNALWFDVCQISPGESHNVASQISISCLPAKRLACWALRLDMMFRIQQGRALTSIPSAHSLPCSPCPDTTYHQLLLKHQLTLQAVLRLNPDCHRHSTSGPSACCGTVTPSASDILILTALKCSCLGSMYPML